MGLHLLLQDFDLLVQGGDDRDQRPGRGCVGGRQRRRLAKVIAAQRRQDGGGPLGDVLAPGALEGGAYLGAGELRGPGGPGCLREQLQRLRGVQVLAEGLQRGREILAQLVPQPLHLPCPLPDQRLVRPGPEP